MLGSLLALAILQARQPLAAGRDLITIRSWFQELREKVLLFAHEMVNEETQEVAARTFLTAVCLGTNTRKARPLPVNVRERIVITLTEGAYDQDSARLRK